MTSICKRNYWFFWKPFPVSYSNWSFLSYVSVRHVLLLSYITGLAIFKQYPFTSISIFETIFGIYNVNDFQR